MEQDSNFAGNGDNGSPPAFGFHEAYNRSVILISIGRIPIEPEIAYFDLMPFAIGKGFEKEALGGAIRIASSFAKRVTLSTCSADHPLALENYLSAGFPSSAGPRTNGRSL